MSFVEMDPELVLKAIEGYSNELEPENKKLEAFYRQARCLQCKGACHKEYDSQHAFSDPDTALPRALMRCNECRALFDPFNSMLIEPGHRGATRSDG